ncbi:FRG domain-containing protein [Xanthobacter autotrophicus]|uniref:FRG domain-containing protein n=1 Tax=Xanthobacter autotrophicus TaxID=280 RepID=UPI00372B4A37
MDTIDCQDMEALERALEALAPGSLLRGQDREYLRQDGGPDLRTSFTRHGCQPARMFKWWHYSRIILATYVKAFDGLSDMAIDQAILQHYGWRSFFLDATSDPTVACWFAANSYRTESCGEMIEDCWGDTVFVRRERAWYEPAQGEGCLYAISRKALRAHHLQAVDLLEITTREGQHRCARQSAFMVGPLQTNLPDDCVTTCIRAPNAVFEAYSSRSAELTAERLFPGPGTDPVMAALLSIPWVKIELEGNDVDDKFGIDFFNRGLPLPEYGISNLRRLGSSSAFYRRFWLADSIKPSMRFDETAFFLTEETLFHGTATGDMRFPRLTNLAREHNGLAVEIDGLVRHPYGGRRSAYSKGIYVEAQPDGAILLTELQTEHPGARPAGFGITRGMYFMPDAHGVWTRVDHPEQCDCGNVMHHAHHLTVAEHFEHALGKENFKPVRDRVFASPNVVTQSDRQALQWMDLVEGDPGMMGEDTSV